MKPLANASTSLLNGTGFKGFYHNWPEFPDLCCLRSPGCIIFGLRRITGSGS
jgi:hypothetical protein